MHLSEGEAWLGLCSAAATGLVQRGYLQWGLCGAAATGLMRRSCLQLGLAVVSAVKLLQKPPQRIGGRVACCAGTRAYLLLEPPCVYAGCELCIFVCAMLHSASLQSQLQAHLHDGLLCFQQLQDLRNGT